MSAPALTAVTPIGHIAAHLPGAAALFRATGIGFCCHFERSLAEAAARRNADTGALIDRLAALADDATQGAPRETGALIEHILTRYHDGHRRETSPA
jgi:regulator of cell morphogenesis and NO signaling